MRRSKLEIYVDILYVLALKGQLKLTHIMYNVNCRGIKEQLDFLLKNGLVEERTFRKEKVVYAITPEGLLTVKAFRELKQVFSNEENRTKQEPFFR